MKFFKSFFKRPVAIVESKPVYTDFKTIDESFKMLKDAIAEVSVAAVNAAKSLHGQLRDTENRFYWTIDSIDDFILIKNGDGTWKVLNKFGQLILSLDNIGDYYKKSTRDIIEEFPHLKVLQLCDDTDEPAWKSKQTCRFQLKIPCKNEFRYVDLIKTPTFNEDGSRKELIIIGRDITELYKQSQRENACFQALNSASDAIAIIDKKSHIFFCNDQFINLFKFKQYHNIINQPLNEILPNFPVFDKMWETIQQNKSWSIYCPQHLLNVKCSSCNVTECPHERSCNKTKCPLYQMHVNIMPMMNGQPKPIYYICTFKTNQYK